MDDNGRLWDLHRQNRRPVKSKVRGEYRSGIIGAWMGIKKDAWLDEIKKLVKPGQCIEVDSLDIKKKG